VLFKLWEPWLARVDIRLGSIPAPPSVRG